MQGLNARLPLTSAEGFEKSSRWLWKEICVSTGVQKPGNRCVTDRHDMTLAVTVALINPFPNKPWILRVCSTSLLKTLWEKEKLLVTSNVSFSHSVFYSFGELSAIFTISKIVVCKLFEFGRVQNLSFGKGSNPNTTDQPITKD